MSIDELKAGLFTVIASSITFLLGRRQSKANLVKTQAEADEIRYSTKIKIEEHIDMEKDKLMKKIDILITKLDEQEIRIDALLFENKKLKTECEELRSELTLYKTIKS